MSQTQPIAPPGQPMKPAQIVDERLRKTSFLTGAMRRPELGALAGLVLVIIFFLFTANSSMFTLSGVMTILAPASQLGILAIAAALLMIGGEFDLSPGFLKAVAAGEAAFAIDQQQFLQGYLPVVFLANYAKYGLIPGGNVPSGPNLITKGKAAQVIELSAKGIR